MKKYIIFLCVVLQAFLAHAGSFFKPQSARGLLTSLRSIRSLSTKCGKPVPFFVSSKKPNHLFSLPQKRTFMTDVRYQVIKKEFFNVENREIADEMAFHLLHLWQEAIRRGDLTLLQQMGSCTTAILKKDKNGSRLLYEAVEKNNYEIVRWLVREAGVDPNEQDEQGRTPLTHAVAQGTQGVAMAQLLIHEGANVNTPQKDGEAPLIAAITTQKGSLDCVRLLLDEGAAIDQLGKGKKSALFRAARLGKNGKDSFEIREIFKELLLRGAKIQVIAENGDTILHVIAKYGNTDLLEIVRDYKNGLDIDFLNDEGISPLCYAVGQSNIKMVELLVESFGADVNAASYWRRTPLMIAKRRDNQEIANYLRNHGAKEKIDLSKIGITSEKQIVGAATVFIFSGLYLWLRS